MTQKEADSKYMQMAHIWATSSKAIRRKVGALMVKDRTIISDGYNGTPSGFPNWCEDYVSDGVVIRARSQAEFDRAVRNGNILKTKDEVLHAEANAITKVAKSTHSSDGATMYCTDAPCIHCAKMMVQAGIVRLVYDRDYHDTSGLDLLKEAGIEIVKFENSESNGE